MSLKLHTLDTPPETLHAALMENGYLIIEELAVDEVAQTSSEMAPHIEAAPLGYNEFLGPRTKRVGSVLARSKGAQQLAIHPLVLALCERTLLPYAANFQLNFSGIMHLETGAAGQNLHRDGLLYPVRQPCPPMVMPTMWALSDFSEENGGTQIVPGSHRWDHDRQPFADEVFNTVMPVGSVLVYLGGTWHGGGENRSNTVRTGLALQYSLSWLRQEENQYLANPPEIAKDYPERLRRLIGYDYGGPYLGFYNGDDPHRVFESGYDGPAMRSRGEIDARYNAIDLMRFGDVKPVPTPEREGERVKTLHSAPNT